MREKFERKFNSGNIGDIGVVKTEGVTYDETVEVLREIEKNINRKLLIKLIQLYGKDNALSIYLKMKEEGEKELKELIEMSQNEEDLRSR